MTLPDVMIDLISQFERLPGVGPKTAQRLAFYLLNFPERELEEFSRLLGDLKTRTRLCAICHNISEDGVCKICSDASRNKRQILVVTNPLDVLALEKTDYKGVYHVLHGLIDPLSHIGPEDIYLADLISRLEDLSQGEDSADIEISEKTFPIEVILATNAGMEGESTAHYIAELIRQKGFSLSQVKITRIGRGLPVGGDIEYADDHTLSRALDGRSAY